MQIESVHHMDQLKSEIRKSCTQHQDDSTQYQLVVEKLKTLVEEGHQIGREEKVLKSLEFDEWKRRFSEVHRAHRQMFQWILDDSKNPATPPTNFKYWLQSQNGLYWVAGKAGSGKSTLMKFVSENSEVAQYLQDWAGPSRRLMLISWFFWAAGSPMQRS